MIPFVRSHGLGNDYLVLRAADLPAALTPAAVRRLCDRHRGVGSDGVLLLVAPSRAHYAVRIFNPDGSEAEKSGNGLRILAKYLVEHAGAPPVFQVETAGGVVECRCTIAGARVRAVAIEMGRASFVARDVPMRGIRGEAVRTPLEVAGERLEVTALTVGNPHCVVFTDRPDEAEARRLGPLLERHAAFPHRTNVQLATPRGRDRVEIRIWERGAGYTLASGSSSCAAAAAAVRCGHCDAGRVTVVMPGGELTVDVRPDWSLRLEGPVEEICTGTLSPDLVTALGAP
ncbi:MAG: diaminopimelate epimerase [Candidatus Binatia bacterium]